MICRGYNVSLELIESRMVIAWLTQAYHPTKSFNGRW